MKIDIKTVYHAVKLKAKFNLPREAKKKNKCSAFQL